MQSIIISGISIAILLLCLVLTKKDKLRADKFLMLYLLYFIVSQTYFYVESTGVLNESAWMIFGKGFYLLGGPLFFYYVHALTREDKISTRLYFFSLLPYVVYVLTFLYYYSQVFYHHQVSVTHGLLYVDDQLSIPWAIFVILFVLTDPFYLVWFYFLLRNYKRRVFESLSFTENVDLNWLKALFYIWIVSAVILFPVAALSIGHSWIPLSQLQMLTQITYVVFIFLTGYFGFRQAVVFTESKHDLEKSKESKSSYQRSGLSREQANLYRGQLVTLMTQQKPYLNSELNAATLSEISGISVNHLSQVLNQELEQNFFDFVNSYRVREVQEKMRSREFEHYTLLAIGLESGFNSKTSFNTIFKKITKQTPSQYYQSIKTAK